MVAIHSMLMASLLSTAAIASPVAAPEEVTEWDSKVVKRDAAPAVLEARQSRAVRCLARVGLGNPAIPPFCGSISLSRGAATGFRVPNSLFPNCFITVEIAFPNCDAYRVVNVQNCGGERQIDIRNPARGCAGP
ncbi:hypothetical protein B9Z65_126 [Elsinoe australis]|uniref:Uncharacterized protein n=1 Tax=Elsinoe australis TaxID=40998 RepID=A0A2P7ZK77_9PEZI|nr:hypothetical protein B9Z65_126 [Elsinoe australis]